MITKLNYTAIVCLFLIGCSSPDSNTSNSEASSNPPPTQVSDISNVKHNSLTSAKKLSQQDAKMVEGLSNIVVASLKL